MFLSGVQFRTRLDSRLKHAGMTDFGLAIYLTQQAAGNQPIDIENPKLSDSPHPQMLGEKIADERAVTKGHIVADVVAAFE